MYNVKDALINWGGLSDGSGLVDLDRDGIFHPIQLLQNLTFSQKIFNSSTEVKKKKS